VILPSVAFLEAVQDVSAGNVKIPQSEFLDHGALAVVDQGQSLVAGYTDDSTASVKTVGPLIVFGDHTRALKYIDFPFAMGADGVKVLRVRDGFDPKYVYHYLRFREVPSVGYSRHFKFLREIPIPRPTLAEQRRIAAILDQADALRAKRRQVLAHLDALSQSIFHDMFGDLVHGSWPVEPLGLLSPRIDSGTSPVCETRPASLGEWGVLKLGAVTYGEFRGSENKAYVGDVTSMLGNEVMPGDVLMTRKNTRDLVGAVAVVEDHVTSGLLIPDLVFRLHLERERLDAEYFHTLMMTPSKRAIVKTLASGSAGSMPNISKARLRELAIELPPMELQREFARRIACVKGQKAKAQRTLDGYDTLFSALQSRAFRGEL